VVALTVAFVKHEGLAQVRAALEERRLELNATLTTGKKR
jgi:hypothetical protein